MYLDQGRTAAGRDGELRGATLTTAMPTDRTYMINPFEWSIIGADAVAETSLASGSSFSCLKQGARLPSGPMSPDGWFSQSPGSRSVLSRF